MAEREGRKLFPIVFTIHMDLEMPNDWGDNPDHQAWDIEENFCLANVVDQLAASIDDDGDQCNVCTYASARLAHPDEDRRLGKRPVVRTKLARISELEAHVSQLENENAELRSRLGEELECVSGSRSGSV